MITQHFKVKHLIMSVMLFLFILSAVNAAAARFGSIAIGIPYKNVGTADNAGAVSVLHGAAPVMTTSNNQLWTQDSDGISGIAETGDGFGQALASGDFNKDGYPDLAVGVPFEAIGAINDAGAVNIIYGSTSGLAETNNQLWYQGSGGITGAAEAADQFGKSLAGGDFNGDGFTDLAVGVPYENIGATSNAGAINIIYGSTNGLISDGNRLFYEGIYTIPGPAAASANFGWALAAADFNNDGFEDLAVGVKGATANGQSSAGKVLVLYGSGSGLSSADNQTWHQASAGIIGTPEAGDNFGSSLTAGDFNNDTFADLAIGVPFEDTAINNVGAVNIIYGSTSGLTSLNNQMWLQGTDGISGVPEPADRFGSSLAAGDFNHDGFTDLAIGVYAEDIGAVVNAGAVNIIYGASTGLTASGNQVWWQGKAGIAGSPETLDGFGFSLAAGDVNNDGYADLAIGVPFESIDASFLAGAVNMIYGSSSGLSAVNNQMFWQGHDGLSGVPEPHAQFGRSLAFLAGKRFPWPMFLPAFMSGERTSPSEPTPDTFSISSSSFNNNQPIPAQYSLLGGNISPQLSWTNVPSGTASFMLTVIDPDGDDWLHWKVKLPATTTSLAENAGASGGANLPAGAIRFDNGFAVLGLAGIDGTDYDGPWPPTGDGVHHYNYKVTALDAGDTELGAATLTGTYEIP